MWEAIGLGLLSLVGSFSTAWLLGRQRKSELELAAEIDARQQNAEWDRQDEVAAMTTLQNTVVSYKLEKIQEVSDQIHVLSNSGLTRQMRQGLESSKGRLVLLKRVIAQNTALKMPASPGDAELMTQLELQISNEEKELEEHEAKDREAERVAMEHNGIGPPPSNEVVEEVKE